MKINVNDATKLQSALDKAQSKCKSRLITIEDIQSAIELVESKIAPLPKAYRKGITFTFANDERIANSYIARSYIAHSTYCTIEHGANGWFIVAVDRGYALKKGSRNGWLQMSDDQKMRLANAIVDNIKL